MAKRRRKSTPTVRRRRRRSSTGGRRHRRAPSRGGVGLLGFVNRDLLVAGGTAMAGFVGSTYLAGKITKWMQEKNPTKQMSPYLAPGIMAGVALAAGAMLRKKSPGLARNVAIGGLAASGGVLLNIVMANSRAQGAAGVHGYELGELVPLQMEDGSTVDGYMLDDGVTAVDGMGNMYDLEAA